MLSTIVTVLLFCDVFTENCHKQAEISFGIQKLTSSTGVQQDDPLGPLLFSLIILELVDEIGPLNDINLKLWYLDNGNFVGHRCKVTSLLEQMKSKGPKYGHQLNMSRCEISGLLETSPFRNIRQMWNKSSTQRVVLISGLSSLGI